MINFFPIRVLTSSRPSGNILTLMSSKLRLFFFLHDITNMKNSQIVTSSQLPKTFFFAYIYRILATQHFLTVVFCYPWIDHSDHYDFSRLQSAFVTLQFGSRNAMKPFRCKRSDFIIITWQIVVFLFFLFLQNVNISFQFKLFLTWLRCVCLCLSRTQAPRDRRQKTRMTSV